MSEDDVKKTAHVDFEKLERELNDMVDKDNRYWVQNDAKFRAAKQLVPYEEFRQIVQASHLKPLAKTDHVNSGGKESRKTIWNAFASSQKSKVKSTKLGCKNTGLSLKTQSINNGSFTTLSEFETLWTTASSRDGDGQEKKVNLLQQLVALTSGPNVNPPLVSKQLDPVVLMDIFTVLNHLDETSYCVLSLQVLEYLAFLPRFELDMAFATDLEKQLVQNVLENVEKALALEPETLDSSSKKAKVSKLYSKYGCVKKQS